MLLFYFGPAFGSLGIQLVKFLFVIPPGSWQEVFDLSCHFWTMAACVAGGSAATSARKRKITFKVGTDEHSVDSDDFLNRLVQSQFDELTDVERQFMQDPIALMTLVHDEFVECMFGTAAYNAFESLGINTSDHGFAHPWHNSSAEIALRGHYAMYVASVCLSRIKPTTVDPEDAPGIRQILHLGQQLFPDDAPPLPLIMVHRVEFIGDCFAHMSVRKLTKRVALKLAS